MKRNRYKLCYIQLQHQGSFVSDISLFSICHLNKIAVMLHSKRLQRSNGYRHTGNSKMY